MLRLILLFNRIRFENKRNIKLRGCFEILESFGGERVNKIRFDGKINRRKLGQKSFYVTLLEKGRKPEKRREENQEGGCDFAF